jgi:hypothetical protein
VTSDSAYIGRICNPSLIGALATMTGYAEFNQWINTHSRLPKRFVRASQMFCGVV